MLTWRIDGCTTVVIADAELFAGLRSTPCWADGGTGDNVAARVQRYLNQRSDCYNRIGDECPKITEDRAGPCATALSSVEGDGAVTSMEWEADRGTWRRNRARVTHLQGIRYL